MSLCKVGNQTSSQDPQAVNSRIFVGNLNTFQVTKTDVEKVFQRYGRIAGISMHKGYAFVQFTSPFDARSACLGEDGRTISSQVIDVNMVSEPKPHNNNNSASGTGANKQVAAKAGSKRGHSESACPDDRHSQHSEDGHDEAFGEKPSKIPRADKAQQPPRQPIDFNNLKTYADTPDTLICGNCKEMFHNIHDMINHKKHYCKLRFTCKCSSKSVNGTAVEAAQLLKIAGPPQASAAPAAAGADKCDISLLCNTCTQAFTNPWDLMVHAQTTHSMMIFEQGEEGDQEEETHIQQPIVGASQPTVPQIPTPVL